jgi:hypothetical protein
MAEALLSKLQKVKKTGSNKWIACCPVHNDTNPSMTITEKDGKTLCFCFACGATGKDVAEAVGIPVSSLFSDSDTFVSNHYHRDRLLAEKDADELFLRLYRKAESEGREIRYSDRKRYKQAINRIEGIERKLAEMC